MSDGDLLASYLGADRGVSFMFDRGVILLDGPRESTGATVVERLDGLLRDVHWRVGQIERAERVALGEGSSFEDEAGPSSTHSEPCKCS